MPESTTYRITLRCGPAASEPTIRLRHLLKTALRTHNMKCVGIETVDDPPTAQEQKQDSAPSGASESENNLPE